jgi:hypothetical protein
MEQREMLAEALRSAREISEALEPRIEADPTNPFDTVHEAKENAP